MCMISKFEQLNNLFEELEKTLDEKVDIYIIGGAVMLYYNVKPITKDVDIVVSSLKEFKAAEKALKKMKFITKIPTEEYKRFDLSQILQRGEFRIDLFQRTVCKGFLLSEGMKKRAMKIRESKHLAEYLCSPTDIFMFKTFTEREGDIADCISLTEATIDWNAMLEEINDQMRISGNKVWITWIGERMDLLIEIGLKIPIIDKVNKLREAYFDEYEGKISSEKK